jgi:hypothetical protein
MGGPTKAPHHQHHTQDSCLQLPDSTARENEGEQRTNGNPKPSVNTHSLSPPPASLPRNWLVVYAP